MANPNSKSIVPIYTSKGDAEAFLVYPHIYNPRGEWIGWITRQREVYSVLGQYVGFLGNGQRILRKQAIDATLVRKNPPSQPQKVIPPATVPLAPLMAELKHGIYDVLLEEPHRLHTIADLGEFGQDLD